MEMRLAIREQANEGDRGPGGRDLVECLFWQRHQKTETRDCRVRSIGSRYFGVIPDRR